jgi:hypothetical protein
LSEGFVGTRAEACACREADDRAVDVADKVVGDVADEAFLGRVSLTRRIEEVEVRYSFCSASSHGFP